MWYLQSITSDIDIQLKDIRNGKKKMGKSRLVIFPTLFILLFVYGVVVGHYQIFPFDELSDLKFFLSQTEPVISPDRPQIYDNAQNISKRITINSENDLIKKRDKLIDYIWMGDGFPSQFPDHVDMNISPNGYQDIKNLERIDSFTINMDFGKYEDKVFLNKDMEMNSIAYLFTPVVSNKKLIIFHQDELGGSDELDFLEEKSKISMFLDNGISVLMFSMPGQGMNNEPVLEFERFGKLLLDSHNHFILIDNEYFHPVKFFVEPIIVSLNYIEQNFDYDDYYMFGISGGGWTTTLTSALDDRISKNYSIAGSFPLYMKSDRLNFGDYEQTIPELYNIATYEELYIMSSFYTDQRSVQIFIYNDPCCFQAELYEKFPYGDAIQDQLDILGGGGKFSVFLDSSTRVHEVSDHALSLVLDDMLNRD